MVMVRKFIAQMQEWSGCDCLERLGDGAFSDAAYTAEETRELFKCCSISKGWY